jgi:hypothetical protein
MDTRNGLTHLRLSRQLEQAANRKPQVGGIPQEANALGNARDTLTLRLRSGQAVGSVCGMVRVLTESESYGRRLRAY